MSVTSIRQKTPAEEQDPPREALRAAIVAERDAKAAAEEAAEDLARGKQLADEAENAVAAATEAIGKAREQDAKAAAKVVKTRADAAGLSATKTASARRKSEDAQDFADIAKSAVARLQQEMAEARREALWAVNRVIEARNACLQPIAQELLARATEFRRGLAAAQGMLAGILFGDGPPPKFEEAIDQIRAQEARKAPLLGLFTALNNFGASDEQALARAAEDEMRRAMEQMLADADFALPPLP